jgi:hypothetical protein
VGAAADALFEGRNDGGEAAAASAHCTPVFSARLRLETKKRQNNLLTSVCAITSVERGAQGNKLAAVIIAALQQCLLLCASSDDGLVVIKY